MTQNKLNCETASAVFYALFILTLAATVNQQSIWSLLVCLSLAGVFGTTASYFKYRSNTFHRE